MILKKKTILLGINQGFSIRYLLQTDIFLRLQELGNRIILLVPDPDDKYFFKYREYNNVVLEKYQLDKLSKYLNNHLIEKFLKLLRSFILNGRYNIQTIRDIFNAYLIDNKRNNDNIIKKIYRLFLRIFFFVLIYSRILRLIILFIEHIFYSPTFHKDIYLKYTPDLLIVSSLGTFDFDQYLIREARKFKVKAVSIVLSWDNTTTRGMPGAIPDHVIAWSDVMREELINLNDISKNKIFVGGVAHYDHYYRLETFIPKDILFNKFGLDLNKKVIFFATKSPNGYAANADIAKTILLAIQEKKLSEECQLLVRLHPIYYRLSNGKYLFQNFLDEFYNLKKEFDDLIINEPIMSTDHINYSMPEEEINILASILKHCDIVVNLFSTLNLEASIFDKPIVNLCFEGKTYNVIQKARYNIFMDEAQNHNQRIIKTNGIKIAYNKTELINYLNQYLLNPEIDQDNRRKIVTQEVWPNPGKAGKVIAEYLLSL